MPSMAVLLVAPRNLTVYFFFNDTATTEIYTLSLHDALPISSARCRPARRAHGGDDERGRGGRAVGAGPEGAPVPRRGVPTVGGAAGRGWRGPVPLGARLGRHAARVASLARELHVLDRAGAGTGGLRRDAEARQRALVWGGDPARRGGGRVSVGFTGVVPGADRRPGAHLRLVARAASRSGGMAHGEAFLRAQRPDLPAPHLVVVAFRAARHGAGPPGARRGPARRPARRPGHHHPRGGVARGRLCVRIQSVGVRVGDVARPQMGQQLVRGVLLHGELPRRVDGARGTGAGGAAAHGPRGTVLRQAAARSRKAVLRLQCVLGLSHVVPVPGDLVRQPA